MSEHLEVSAILPLSATTLDRVRVVDRPRFVAEIARRRLCRVSSRRRRIDLLTAGIFATVSLDGRLFGPRRSECERNETDIHRNSIRRSGTREGDSAFAPPLRMPAAASNCSASATTPHIRHDRSLRSTRANLVCVVTCLLKKLSVW